MVILRPTKKLHAHLPVESVSGASDTALGDWYANRIVVHRQPLLLLVSATSLYPMLLPDRDVRALPGRLATLVTSRLRRLGVEDDAIAAEAQAMRDVALAPTADRSVLGIMVDFALALPYYLARGQQADDDLLRAEDRLADTPCHASKSRERVVFPNEKAPALLRAKWLGGDDGGGAAWTEPSL